MEQRLPSPSTPPEGPADVGRDATKAAINDNLEAAGGVSGKAVGVATPAATPGTQVAQTKPGLWGAAMEAFNKFSDDDGMTQAAALAFYTGLALAPLLTVVVWVMQLVTPVDAKEKVITVAMSVVGPQAGPPVRQLISPESVPDPKEVAAQAATRPAAATMPASAPVTKERKEAARSNMTVAGIASVIFLAFTASSVLAQLQSSLNLIWNVKPDPKKSGIIIMIRKRIFSFGMLFTILFLLLVSMMITFIIGFALKAVAGDEVTMIAQAVNLVVSFAIATGVFMLLFTYLPDVRVPWRDTLFGAALTAVLFIVGRYGIGLYLTKSDYSTSYGAAVGSFLALLVWVYYTSIIMFIGTEATTVYTRRHGHNPRPEKYAVRTMRTERVLDPVGDQPKPARA